MIPASLGGAPIRVRSSTRWRAIVIALVAVVAVATAAWFARATLLRWTLQGAVGLATGYKLRIGELTLGRSRLELQNVHLSRRGDPVLDASSIALDYSWRDLFPGSKHRYGISAVDVVRPHLYLVRRADRSYNISFPHAKPQTGRPPSTPLVLRARVRDGVAEFIDPRNPDPAGRRVEIRDIEADASVNSTALTRYRVDANVISDARNFPIHAQATIDTARRYAIHRITSRAVPLRGLGNFLIDSRIAEIQRGELRDLDVRLYALDLPKEKPAAYHLAGGGRLDGVAMKLDVLTQPVHDLLGRIDFDDDAIVSPRIHGRIGTTPLVGAGGMYDFADPQFRLAILTKEDLSVLHRDFNFLKREPLSGPMDATCMLEGSVTRPLIMSAARAKHVNYGRIAVHDFRATIAYHEGVVFAGDVAGSVGNVRARVAARFLTGGKDVDALIALAADAPPGTMPYVDRIAPHAATHFTLTGAGLGLLLDTHGVMSAAGGGEAMSALFALDPHGVGELGPFTLRQPHGSVIGGFVMDRERGTSALWANAHNLTLAPADPRAVLPGVNLPEFPPLAGRFDGKFAGVDVDRQLVLLGTARARDAKFLDVPIAQARADFAGPVDRMALGGVVADGEFGHFQGRGEVGGGSFAFAGNLDGTLEGMRRWTGDLGARGKLRGPIAVISQNGRTLVQTRGVDLHDASVHGIGLHDLAGTFVVDPSRIIVYGASADIAGGRVVARGDSVGGIRLSTAGIAARDLQRAGLPLERGTLVGDGDLRLFGKTPSFDGTFALEDGRVQGRRVDGSAQLAFAHGELNVDDATVAVSRAFGFLDGTIATGEAGTHYDLRAQLAYADLAQLATAVPVPYLRGTVQGDVHVWGMGARPNVDGKVRIPQGSINGLNFGDVRTHVQIAPHAISASGSARVGSTYATFSAARRGIDSSVALDAGMADLADFNDFFPTAEMLSGQGSFHAQFARERGATYSSGSVDLNDLRFQRFKFGHAVGSWTGARGNIHGDLTIAGTAGTLEAHGTVVIPPGTRISKIPRQSDIDLTTSLHGVDLAAWLPALGYLPPVAGRVDATTTIRGKYPSLALDFDGSLSGGMIGRIPIDRFRLSAAAQHARTQIRALDLAIAGVDVKGSGSFGLGPKDNLALDFDATTDKLGDFIERIWGNRYGLGGAGNVHLAVRGTPSHPSADGSFLFRPLYVWNLAIPSVIGNVSLDPQRLALRDATISLQSGSVTLAGSVPLLAGPVGIPQSTPLSFDLGLRDVALDQFAALAPPQTKLIGDLRGLVQVRGTVGEPHLTGSVDLTGGGYSGPLETQPISDVDATVAFDQTTASLSRFNATVGGGRLTGTGSLRIPGGRASYDAEFKLDAVRVAFPGYGSTRADGSVWLRRPAPKPAQVGGELTISDASIPLAAFMKAAGPATGPGFVVTGASVPGPSIAAAAFGIPIWLNGLGLDMHLTAGNNVRLRSPILDIGGRGSVRIAGTVASPSLNGELVATPGGSLFLNRAFKLQEASVRFTPQNGISPDLYARATTQIAPAAGLQPIDVTVTAQGLIPDIRLSYASNPPYDEATIVGLLFGANSLGASVGAYNTFAPSTNILLPPNAFQQTPSGTFALSQEAAGLINAQFTARLLAPIEQGLGSAFGLSDLAINLAPSGSVGVQARRLLGRNVSALYGTSLTYPYRMTFGLESRPDLNTSVIFTAFTQQGLYSFGAVKPDAYLSANPLLGSAADIGGTQGFTVNIQRRFR